MNAAPVKPAIGCSAGLVLILTLALAAPANAQLKTLNAIGYGAAGATFGLLATSGAQCTSSSFFCIPPVMVFAGLGGMAAGAILGSRLGGSAEASVERGEPLNNLWAVTAGAVLGGAFLGVVVGDKLRESGAVLGSDGQTVAILALVGAGFATLYLRSRWDELAGKTLEVTPAIVGGEAGLTARIRF